jgi:2-oxo-4-hydroxy-4-carboxy-5-ureidoimidazoline decarboxylase
MRVDELNQLPSDEAVDHFLRCCGSRRWAERMAAGRPYEDVDQVHEAAGRIWNALSREDWMEAFTAHPRIGDVNSLRKKFENTRTWASGEQSGVNAADEAVIAGLADGNGRYEDKFGFIFIVCATGKSAREMLDLLLARLPNSRDEEIRNAGAEQLKITNLRIDKWLNATGG